MNDLELMQKFMTKFTTGDISYGLMEPEQANRFIDMFIEKSQLMQMVDVRRVSNKAGDFYKIDMAQPATVAAAEANEYTDETGQVSHSKYSYTCVKRRTQFELTWEDIAWTVEQNQYRQHVISLWNRRWALDTEILAIQGDEDLYASPSTAYEKLVDINEGWLQQISAGNGAHILDAAGLAVQYVTPEMFAAAYNLMPTKYLVFGRERFRWFTSPHVAADYRHYLMTRQTGLGDAVLNGSTRLAPDGIEIVEIAQFPENLDASGVVDTSSPGDKCTIVLMDPSNLVWVVHREMSLETRRIQEKDSWRYTGYSYDDFIVTNPDAIVKVINVARNTDYNV